MERTLLRLVVSAFLFFVVVGVAKANQMPHVGEDFDNRPCSGSVTKYGPFDYTKRTRFPKQLYLVESAHFTNEVESLIRGATNTTPYQDLAYTLGAWPNHHRALNAISKYHLRLKKRGKRIPIAAECWFQRAVAYSPNDAISHMLFGNYLHKSNRLTKAEELYNKALELNPENIQIHYNYGLLLIELKKYSKAKHHAEITYRKKFPLSGLKNKLKKLGFWP